MTPCEYMRGRSWSTKSSVIPDSVMQLIVNSDQQQKSTLMHWGIPSGKLKL